jgi:hypothetical protein
MAFNDPTAIRYLLPIAAFLALTACGENSSQSGPGGLTPEDARALDDAAEKLDAKALPPPTLEQMAPPKLQPVVTQPAATPSSATVPQKAPAAPASEKPVPVKK